MSVLFIAVPAALAFALSAVIAFLWASRSGQLDDLDTPPLRMLHDEPPRREAARGGSPQGPAQPASPAASTSARA
jgi:cbb3-type cytochrome oxidase maturation protein